ncbi:MAG TPA: hypothetical protein VK953_02625, partial [Methylophilus sp.]|nr:hypothetical protein [Methylophilus sp.]
GFFGKWIEHGSLKLGNMPILSRIDIYRHGHGCAMCIKSAAVYFRTQVLQPYSGELHQANYVAKPSVTPLLLQLVSIVISS